MTPSLRGIISGAVRDSRVRFGVSLRPMTTLRVGGEAEALVDVETEADLVSLFQALEQHQVPCTLLGKGSNLLVPERGVPGVVIRLGKGFSSFEADGGSRQDRSDRGEGPRKLRVTAGAALPNAQFVERCRKMGLGGMEFLIAVPGNIGGAIAMNAGAHQGETAQTLTAVRLYEQGVGLRDAPAADFSFGYRHSELRGALGRVVLRGVFTLPFTGPEISRERIETFQAYRRDTQPRDFPNCGSVFKNPPGDYAARLIEAAGLKGFVHGAAQVSAKHANFIVNRGGATADEVLGLIDLVRERVWKFAGVRLELELQEMIPAVPGSPGESAPRTAALR